MEQSSASPGQSAIDALNGPSGWQRWLPFLGFWQGPKTAMADLIAGITVGLVLVPQAMAYAALAGADPINGLYAASFACMAGAMLGRCPQLNTGPVAMTALLSMAAVQPLAGGDHTMFLSLLAILALLVGAIRIILGLCRGAVLVALISKPVLVGFASAAGITIASTQVPKIFGVNPGHENPVFNSLAAVVQIGQAHWPSVAIGLGSLAVMMALKKWLPRWPNLLIGMVLAGLVSWLFDYAGAGGAIIGELPQGLPEWTVPTIGWEHAPALLGGAMLVVVIGLLEAMTVTSAAERVHGKPTDLNAELVGQGAASLVAGVTQGFPVSGSLSRSSLNMMAGAQTGLSSVISGLVVVLTLLFLTPLLKPLPYPALAAAIVMAVSALVRPQDLITAWRISKPDAIFGWVTMLTTLALAPSMVVGMASGLAMTIGYSLWRVMHPRVIITHHAADGRDSAAPDQHDPRAAMNGRRLVIRVDARITHLNVGLLRDRLQQWLYRCPAGTEMVLNCCAINEVDVSGCDMLADFATKVDRQRCRFALADLKAPVRARIDHCPALADVPRLATAESQMPFPDGDPPFVGDYI